MCDCKLLGRNMEKKLTIRLLGEWREGEGGKRESDRARYWEKEGLPARY